MKKLRCLLVDDEPLAISLLAKHISQVEMLEVAGTCANALKALELLKTQPVDLLFLDIRMPSLSGIGFLKTLRNPPPVIITTAYREYALDGYDLDVIDYLLKPVTFDRFIKAIHRAQSAMGVQPAPDTQPAPGPQPTPVLFLKSGYRHVRISVDEILYLESLKDYIKIHTPAETIISKMRISEMEAKLPPGQFLRIHRSFIINLRQLTAFTASQVELGPTELPIGESYKELVVKAIRSRG
ncbi:LytTR family DNA-binding domain-containing protein [Puia sp.]|jgi:DNA-binding LytR/AlgR family response regulator|uniref:LytR/AlgR family response regulator transcription factor n=1 Tax=Puia sp. TaxID=2045100 RepID=UPI002F429076